MYMCFLKTIFVFNSYKYMHRVVIHTQNNQRDLNDLLYETMD